jgi:hypothetical protein
VSDVAVAQALMQLTPNPLFLGPISTPSFTKQGMLIMMEEELLLPGMN